MFRQQSIQSNANLSQFGNSRLTGNLSKVLERPFLPPILQRMPEETARLRARAKVASVLASVARDAEVASVLHQVAEEFEEEAYKREMKLLRQSDR